MRFCLVINLNANFVGNQTDEVLTAVSLLAKRGHIVSIDRPLVYGADEKLVADVIVAPREDPKGLFKGKSGSRPGMISTSCALEERPFEYGA